LDGNVNNAIPLTGTTVGNPVTGNIEFNRNSELANLVIWDDSGSYYIDIKDYLGNITTSIADSSVSSLSFIVNNADPLAKGIEGLHDFSPNITNLDYTQKIYVDTKVAASRPYKVYTALLNQTGTAAPTAIVLENTLGGTVNFEYNSLGTYSVTSSALFTLDKTTCIGANRGMGLTGCAVATTSSITLYTSYLGSLANGFLINTYLEIRVYP